MLAKFCLFALAPLLFVSASFADPAIAIGTRDNWTRWANIMPVGYRVLRPPAEVDAELQAYFRNEIWARIALPNEDPAAMPKIVLVNSAKREALAFVVDDNPDVIFWHAGFLVGSPWVDIDCYVAAHELRHTLPDNAWSTRRGREFDADLSTGQRLFRFRLRDANGQPQPMVIHVGSLLKWLRKGRGYNENYIDRDALSTAAVLAFGRERLRRAYPLRPTPRDGVKNVRRWVKSEMRRTYWSDLWTNLKSWRVEIKKDFDVPVAVLGQGYDQVVIKAQRLRGQFVNSFKRLEEMRLEYLDTAKQIKPGSGVAAEFLYTYMALSALVDRRGNGPFLAQLFRDFSKLPPDLFVRWAPLTHPVYMRTGFGTFPYPEGLAQQFDWVNQFASEEKIEDHFDPASSVILDDKAIVFGASRVMERFLTDPDARNLSQRPLATLAYLAIAGASESLFERKSVKAPRLVTRFRESLTESISKASKASDLASSYVEFVTGSEYSSSYRASRLGYQFGQAQLRKHLPDLARKILARIPPDPIFARWRFELGGETDVTSFLRRALDGDGIEFLHMLQTVTRDKQVDISNEELERLWVMFLERTDGAPYVRGMDNLFSSPYRNFGRFNKFSIRSVDDLNRAQARGLDNVELRIGRSLTARVARDWKAFFAGWKGDHIAPLSPMLYLVDWSTIFGTMSAEELAQFFAMYPDSLTSDAIGWSKLREAVLERLLVFSADIRDSVALRTTLAGLNLLSSSSDTGQMILKNLLRQMTADDSLSGAVTLLEFLRAVRLLNFSRLEDFIELYTDAVVRISGGDDEFARVPMARLRLELTDIKQRFEPQVATRLLQRLAERHRADWSLKSEFELSLDHNSFVGQDNNQLWSNLIATINPESATELAFMLRENKVLSRESRFTLQAVLAGFGYAVTSDEVDGKVRAIFASIGPVRQMAFLADPKAEVMRTAPLEMDEYEKRLRSLLSRVADEKDRKEYIDTWVRAYRNLNDQTRAEREKRMRLKFHQRGISAAEDFQVLFEVAKKLREEQTLELIETLRSGTKLSLELRGEVQSVLIKHHILVQSAAVEDYLSQRFQNLQPYERAGLLKLILDASNDMLGQYGFRKRIFAMLLASFPDRDTRDTFIDLWGAGLSALPKELHSLVLAVVLAESGKVGTPETALVTLLSSMSSLEQKFGQALAFADLPETYRQALRKLWDGAQNLDWFGAWDLILVQHGDIRKAGFRLNRILNSGSTAAYLEIVHEDGRKFALPVYRDGIAQGVRVGRDQLRIFARAVARKSPKRYGFLPLLVEDAVRTMELELDPSHKERMTLAMAARYRDAGVHLGWRAEASGVVDGEGWTYRHLDYHSIALGGGKVVRVQDVAQGVGLGHLELKDPALYRRLTAKILELENAVNASDSGPVDKDRMPGQFMVDVETRTVYILDHGQAATLDPKVRSQFREFTKLGFAADVAGLSRMTEELTGMKPRGFDLGNRVRGADASVRPFVFLNEVSADYLKLDPKDPRAERFFDLLHGVRAQLRLFQWEISEGHSQFTGAVRKEILAETDHRTLAWRTALGWVVRETSELWRKIKSRIIPAKWRMEYGYRRRSKFDCQEALEKAP